MIGLGIALVAAYARWVEPAWVVVTRHEVDAHLRAPLTIAQISDLHSRGVGRTERAVLAILDEERPDLIVLTGDCVADDGTLSEALEMVARLRAPLGVFAVDGNWEYWRSAGGNEANYARAGARLLRNANYRPRDDVCLVGLDDALAGHPDIDMAFRGVPPDAYTIALFHCPALYDRVADRCSLALAGHTHGGQVRFPLFGPIWTPPGSGDYVDGWYSRGRSRMYVSRGVGTSILALRFLCRPEVAILHMR
jgi:predicted MPP superfamily phosphohydrolase